MKNSLRIGILLCCMGTVLVGNLLGQTAPAKPAIDPLAEKLIGQLSERFRSINYFKFQIADTMDDVRENGQKLQFAHLKSGIVSKPDKFRIDNVGDLVDRTFLKDDQTFTLIDRNHKVYGQLPFTGTIDQLMDKMQREYGVNMPLADLLSSDTGVALLSRVKTGEYLGLHYVGDVKCHHLAFTQDTIDWQAWIDSGDKPRIRKMVINYKTLPGEPQYTMLVQNVEPLSVPPAADVFQFQAPEGYNQIKFQPVNAPKSPLPGKAQ